MDIFNHYKPLDHATHYNVSFLVLRKNKRIFPEKEGDSVKLHLLLVALAEVVAKEKTGSCATIAQAMLDLYAIDREPCKKYMPLFTSDDMKRRIKAARHWERLSDIAAEVVAKDANLFS